jgi:hypothetical protein
MRAAKIWGPCANAIHTMIASQCVRNMYNAHIETKYDGAQMYSHGKLTESFKALHFDIDVINECPVPCRR